MAERFKHLSNQTWPAWHTHATEATLLSNDMAMMERIFG
jgi:hypothetical protein